MRTRDLRHPYSNDLIECQYCDTGVMPGERCNCHDDDSDCCVCGGLIRATDNDAVRTGNGPAHEDCAEAAYGPNNDRAGLPAR